MKIFLKKCLYFFSPLLFLGVLLNTLGDHILKNSDNVQYKRWEDLRKPIEADLLITGNSRAQFHVDPFILDSILHVNTYNMGISGGPIELSDVAWNLYHSHNKKKTRVVLCNVDFLWFGGYDFPYNKNDYLLYLQDPDFSEIMESLNYSPAEKYIPGMKYAGRMRLVFENYRKSNGNSDNSKEFKKGALLVDQEYRELVLFPPSCHFKRSPKRIALFDKFIDECRSEGIEVILFLSPIQQVAYKDLTGIDDSFALIDSLAVAGNIPVLNYTNFMINDSSCFLDPIHLNKKGAELFSVRLANDVDSLLKECNIKL